MSGILTAGCFALWTRDGEREEVQVIAICGPGASVRCDDGAERVVWVDELERRDGPEAHGERRGSW